jgi:hypothetical protein
VYFPVDGICSIVAKMADRATIEVASVGNEGIVGLTGLGRDLGCESRFLQVSNGTAQYMAASVFESLCVATEFGRAVDRFRGFFLRSIMQLGACNSLHPVQARCARWILFAHERLGRAQFDVTEPLLMTAAGAAADVHPVIGDFCEQGIIKYRHGTLTVLDPIALRRLACSCYGVLTSSLKSLGFTPRRRQRQGRKTARNIVRLRSASVCTLCGLATGVPHKRHADCLRAIDEEMRSLLAHTRKLARQRNVIVRENMQKFEKFLKRRES